MTNSDQLQIPLRKSTNATILEDKKYLLQQKALNSMTEIINNNLNKIINDNINELDRNHDTITLLGERGTGKTSFLINFRHFYENKDKVIFLETIDPTLFEDRQNILITIISMIVEEIRDKNYDDNEEWLNNLSSLSEGLNLLDGVGADPLKKDIWDDARIILEVGLKNAYSGLNLEKNFNKFIKKSLKLLDKKMFIITFDDIDTDIKKGWPVLEVIRKYLTSPFIQIIISGDWNLYSKIVRLHQWKQIKETPEHSVEKDKIIIDQLEEQYLTKILKPENRIVLKDLKSIINDGNKILISDSKTELEDIDLEKIYKEIFSDILSINSNKTIKAFTSLLLSLPVRTNIQILIAYFDYIFENTKKEQILNLNRKFFLEKLSNIFITKIGRFNFNDKDFDLLSSEETLSFIVKKLYEFNQNEEHDLIDLFNFNPIYDSEDMNIFILVLNAYIVNIINNKPYKIFEWLFRIQYFNKFITEYNFNYKTICNYLSYNINIPITEQITKIIGLGHSNKIIGFSKLYIHQRWNKNPSLKSLEKFKQDIEKNTELSSDTKLTCNFLLNISIREIQDKGETETKIYISLLNILSFISEALVNSSNIDELVKKQMIVAYSEKSSDSTIYYENYEETYENLNIIKEFKEWLELSNKLKSISIELVNSIWNEYYMTLQSLPSIDNYKDFIEHQLIRLFNTILKETERKNNNSTEIFPSIKTDLSRLERGIRKSSYQNFYQKIKMSIDFKEFIELDFFEFLLICPLWKYYIDFPISENVEEVGLLAFGAETNIKYSDLFNKLALHKDKNEIISIEVDLDDEEIKSEIASESTSIDLSEESIITNLIKENIEKLDDTNVETFIWDIMRNQYAQYKNQRVRQSRKDLIRELYAKIKNS
jgi:hypothetical protein